MRLACKEAGTVQDRQMTVRPERLVGGGADDQDRDWRKTARSRSRSREACGLRHLWGVGTEIHRVPVFVCSGCHDKTPQTRWLRNNDIYFPGSRRLGSPRSKHRQLWRLARAHFLGHSQPSSQSPPGGRGKVLSETSFVKGTNPISEGPTPMN